MPIGNHGCHSLGKPKSVLQTVCITESIRSFPRKKGTLAFNGNGTLGSWLDGKGLHLDGKGLYVGFMVGPLGYDGGGREVW